MSKEVVQVRTLANVWEPVFLEELTPHTTLKLLQYKVFDLIDLDFIQFNWISLNKKYQIFVYVRPVEVQKWLWKWFLFLRLRGMN